MHLTRLHIGLLFFWALSILGAPLSLLVQPDENIRIVLNAGEEEHGEHFKTPKLEEKLLVHSSLEFSESFWDEHQNPVATPELRIAGLIQEIILPPPETSLA